MSAIHSWPLALALTSCLLQAMAQPLFGRRQSIAVLPAFYSSSKSILRRLVNLTSICLSALHWPIVLILSLKHSEPPSFHTLLVTTRSLPYRDKRICRSSFLFLINLIVRSFLIVLPFLSNIPYCLRAFIESTAGLLTKPLFVFLSLLVLLFPFMLAVSIFTSV